MVDIRQLPPPLPTFDDSAVRFTFWQNPLQLNDVCVRISSTFPVLCTRGMLARPLHHAYRTDQRRYVTSSGMMRRGCAEFSH